MKNIKKILTLQYVEGVILVTMYRDDSMFVVDHLGTEHNFSKRNACSAWFKKKYGAVLCF